MCRRFLKIVDTRRTNCGRLTNCGLAFHVKTNCGLGQENVSEQIVDKLKNFLRGGNLPVTPWYRTEIAQRFQKSYLEQRAIILKMRKTKTKSRFQKFQENSFGISQEMALCLGFSHL